MLSMPWPRFYAQQLPEAGVFALDEIESHHLAQVLRLAVGQTVVAFDGCGGEAECLIIATRKKSVELQVVRRSDTSRELNRAIDMFVALPKGDRQKQLIESLVQLGVRSLCPLITERGVAQPVESAVVRLRRTVIDASKQCGRNRLMAIHPPAQVSELLAAGRLEESALKWVAHPYGQAVSVPDFRRHSDVCLEPVCIVIGPEGGLTDDEVCQLNTHGWNRLSLGSRILRVETAAIYIASQICN